MVNTWDKWHSVLYFATEVLREVRVQGLQSVVKQATSRTRCAAQSTVCVHWMYDSIFNFHLLCTKEIFRGRHQRAVLQLGGTPLMKWKQCVSCRARKMWQSRDGPSPPHPSFGFLYPNYTVAVSTAAQLSVSWTLVVKPFCTGTDLIYGRCVNS